MVLLYRKRAGPSGRKPDHCMFLWIKVVKSGHTCPRLSRPSMRASRVDTTDAWIWSCLTLRTGASPSISSKKIIDGCEKAWANTTRRKHRAWVWVLWVPRRRRRAVGGGGRGSSGTSRGVFLRRRDERVSELTKRDGMPFARRNVFLSFLSFLCTKHGNLVTSGCCLAVDSIEQTTAPRPRQRCNRFDNKEASSTESRPTRTITAEGKV